MNQDDTLDVAIVGAGIGGLYAGWRLLESGTFPPDRIALFEAHQVPGGRIRSVVLPGSGGLAVEAGAMAFPLAHRRVMGLIAHLGLEARDHPIGSRRSLLQLRGRTLSYHRLRHQLGRPFRYAIPRSGQIAGAGARGLLVKASERLLPGSSAFTPEAWEDAAETATFGGRPLRDWPLRVALMQVLTAEEVDFLEKTSGYAIFTGAPNAATGLAWSFSDLDAGRLRVLAGGLQSLPLSLAARIGARGGTVHCSHQVEQVMRTPDGFTLVVRNGRSGEARMVPARRLVIALPRVAIEKVAGLAELVGADLLRRTVPWPMCTISLIYPSAWWTRIGIEHGRSLSDLPIRQVWQHGASPDAAGFLCSHSDGENAGYWRSLAPPSGDQGFLEIEPDGPLAREAHRQIVEIYGRHIGEDIPLPTGGHFQDWAAPAFGGAFHAWAKGVRPRPTAEAAMQPAADLPLFICGEAWSRSHGWVEGAIGQTEAMLSTHFRLAAPTWLK